MWSVLDTSPFANWVNAAPWPYPTLLTAHGLGMAVVVGLTTVLALRVLGFPKAIPLGAYAKTLPLLVVSFVVNAASGVALFVAAASTLAANVAFQVKLAAIVVGLFVLWRLYKGPVAAAARSEEYQPTQSDKALAVAAILIWVVSVIVSGRLVAYLSEGF